MRISKETIAILLLTWSVVSVVGVLRIASVIALSSDLAAPSTAMRDGELFWQENINDRGGVLINGTRRLVEIISVDVGASTYEEVLQKVTDTAYRISNGTYGEIHAVFTPYTSVLTEAFMLVAEKSKIFSCSSSASSPFVFACDQENREPCTKGRGRRFAYLVGLQASTATVFPPVISLVNIKGAESIGVFREVGTNDLFFIAEKDGAINAAEDNSMEVVLDTTVPSATEATSEETRNNYLQLISQLQIAKPDVVVGAVLEQGCQAFVMAAKELNYTADAWILSVCLNPDEYRQVVGEDGRYLIIPIDWDPRLTGRIYNEDGSRSIHFFPTQDEESSPHIFANEFAARFGYQPNYISAAQFACGLALQYAAETSESLETEAMLNAINTINEITFYGQIQFNPFGQILDTASGCALQFDRNNCDNIILPIFASTSDVIYPMPSWYERVNVITWYGTPMEIGIISVAGVCFLGCIALAVLFAAMRNKPQIVASSLLFVELIILGATMMYAGLFFGVLETTTVMCNLRIWLEGVGFVLMFSALLTKTWRVWRIFHEKSLRVIKITNVYLLRIMSVALGIEIILLIIWTAGFTPVAETIVVDVNRPILDYRVCNLDNALPIEVVLIVYYGLLITTGIVFGFWSRKARSEFNESKFILFSMYNVAFAAIILLVLFCIQVSDRSILFLIRSIAVLWGVTATLCLLLIPKIYYVTTGSKDHTKRRHTIDFPSSPSMPSTYQGAKMELEQLVKRERALRERLDALRPTSETSTRAGDQSQSPANRTEGTIVS